MSYTGNAPTTGVIDSYDIVDGSLIAADLADAAVTTAKIANGAVTDTKLAADAVTTAKIINGAVTAAKLASGVVTPLAVSDTANTSTGFFDIPVGDTSQRPVSPTSGQIRYNTDTPGFEGYGSAWGALGGGNTTTKGMWENANSITVDYTITTNNNAVSAGPITIASGITVTVPSGSTWVIV